MTNMVNIAQVGDMTNMAAQVGVSGTTWPEAAVSIAMAFAVAYIVGKMLS